MDEIEISPQFRQVLSFINLTGRSVFLTGKAGTGKTTLLRYIRENTHKQLAVCAPTGVAAINAGGTTIHSLFQFPFTPFLPVLREDGEIDLSSGNLPVLKYNSQRLGLFRRLELLVIDEVSMVRADLLDQIDITLRQVRRKWNLPFGGVQLLLIGDMHQLPPVIHNAEWDILGKIYKGPYFFESIVIRKNPPVYIELDKIYRQSEQSFVRLLNLVRNNQLDDESLSLLNAHYKSDITKEDYAKNITLTTHNRKADEINQRNLADLPGEALKIRAEVTGIFPEKNYPADEELILKPGTRVMFLKNNVEKNYYNGKIGIVTQADKKKVLVKCEGDKDAIDVTRETWNNVTYKVDRSTSHVEEDVIGTFIQFPLRLAWAITIHKSQGLTFDRLIIDAAASFTAGQVYVALSRCRSLAGLILSSRLVKDTLQNDPSVLRFSSAQPAQSEVEATFHSARHNYLSSVLQELFTFSEESAHRKELAALLQVHEKKLSAGARSWADEVFSQTDELGQVSLKFGRQLGSMLDGSSDIENDPGLQERIRQAAVYFSAATGRLLELLDNCRFSTESRESADDINELLRSLHESLFLRNELLLACKDGFSFDRFIRKKLGIVYPTAKINIYASAGSVQIPLGTEHPELYRRLVRLRDEICSEAGKPIYFVANAKTLAEIARYMPSEREQLLSISGFGEAKVLAFGDRFLELVKDYKQEHDIRDTFVFPGENEKKKKKKKKSADTVKAPAEKTGTREKTFRLFRDGIPPEEIARQRGCTLGTVISHLENYVKAGEVAVQELVSAEKVRMIEALLSKSEPVNSIAPLKSALPEEVSYSDIRLVLASRAQGN